MPIAFAGSVSGIASGADDIVSVASASHAPLANELILAWVGGDRPTNSNTTTSQVSSVTGNGLPWVRVPTIDEYAARDQDWLSVWRAMGASPSAGAVTANISNATDSAVIIVTRWSGVDTSGTNGSGAVEANAENMTNGTDNAVPTVSVTPITADAMVVAGFNARGKLVDFDTGITDGPNDTAGAGGGATTVAVGYKLVASPAATAMSGTISAAEDWTGIAVALKPASAAAATSPILVPRSRSLLYLLGR